MDEIKEDVERTRQDEREEETEARQVHVPLRAEQMLGSGRKADLGYELELSSSQTRFDPDVRGLGALGEFSFRCYTEHALESVNEEDSNKTVRCEMMSKCKE